MERLKFEECKNCRDWSGCIVNCMDTCGKPIDALKEFNTYKTLEEQGNLLKLPCAVGETVYTNTAIQGWHLKKKDRPYEVKVVFIGINGADNCMHVAYDNGCMSQFWFSEMGKTIFLTREEAETALKEL